MSLGTTVEIVDKRKTMSFIPGILVYMSLPVVTELLKSGTDLTCEYIPSMNTQIIRFSFETFIHPPAFSTLSPTLNWRYAALICFRIAWGRGWGLYVRANNAPIIFDASDIRLISCQVCR